MADVEPVKTENTVANADKVNVTPVVAPVAKPAEIVVPFAVAAPVKVEAATPAPAAAPKQRKPRAVKPKAAPKPAAAKTATPRKKAAAVAKPAAKTVSKAKAAPAKKAAPKATTQTAPKASPLKEKIMATKNQDFAEGLKTAFADTQDKAKAAFEKSQAAFSDCAEFTKGNVEAVVESGKILANGLQKIGSSYVEETRSSIETLTADVKEITSVKTPADFFKVQNEVARRNLDHVVAFNSKNGEALLKLVNDVFAPISGRVNLAIEKAKRAA